MKELIPITQSESGEHLVDARMLHEFLEVRRDFSTWIKERIGKFGFIDGEDYITFSPDLGKNQRGRPTTDYGLTLDMAKQLCMVENNDKGTQARKYFIECERRAKALVPRLGTRTEILQQLKMATEIALELEAENRGLQKSNQIQAAKIEEDSPKVEFYDDFMDSKGNATMSRVAKILGVGPINLFKILRENKVLMSRESEKNLPYQKYIDAGWFVVKASTFIVDGIERGSSKTLVTPKGIAAIGKKLVEHGYITGQADLFVDASGEGS